MRMLILLAVLSIFILMACTPSANRSSASSESAAAAEAEAEAKAISSAASGAAAHQGMDSVPIIIICNQAIASGGAGDRDCMRPKSGAALEGINKALEK